MVSMSEGPGGHVFHGQGLVGHPEAVELHLQQGIGPQEGVSLLEQRLSGLRLVSEKQCRLLAVRDMRNSVSNLFISLC